MPYPYKSKFRSNRAYSLLEYAAVLPVFLFFIFGAIDITNIMRGYTALQAGVEKTLRCLYPTDAECVQAIPDSRARLFDVVHKSSERRSFIPTMSYEGISSWIEQPVDIYTDGEAIILNQGSYEPPPMRAVLSEQESTITDGTVSYLIQLYSEPYISGDPLNPNFGTDDANGHRNNYPAAGQGSINISGIELVSHEVGGGDTEANSGTFTIDSPPGDTSRCFLSNNFNKPLDNSEPTANFSESCDVGDMAPIVFHISGDITNSDPGAQGDVEISLCYGNGNCTDLGGRQIINNPGSSGDFVPRGYRCNDKKGDCPRVDSNIIDEYPLEASRHHNIDVPWDTKFYFKFKLIRKSGSRIGWSGEKIKVFWPVYATVNDAATCNEPVKKSELNNQNKCCKSDHPSGLKACNLKAAGEIVEKEKDSVPIPCGTKINEVPQYLNSKNKKDINKYTIKLLDGGSCSGHRLTENCPPNNQGISDGLDDLSNPVCDSAEAASVCPITNTDWSYFNATPPNQCWTKRKINVSFPPFEHIVKDCQHLTPPRDKWPSELLRYSHPILSPPTSSRTEKLCTLPLSQDSSPADIVKLNSKFNCGRFSSNSFTYNSNSNPQLPPDSLFRGKHPHLGCGWIEKLKDHANAFNDPKLKLDPNCFFSASAKMAGRIEVSTVSDNCTPVEYENTEVLSYTPLGIYKEGQLPEICDTPDRPCIATFKGYDDEGQAAEAKLLGDLAVSKYGIPEILATFPNAKFVQTECKGALCASISAAPDMGDSKIIQAQAKLNVPLYLGNLFGNDSIELSYKDEAKLEKSFASEAN